MSPPVRREGAKGPTKREIETQKRRDLKGSIRKKRTDKRNKRVETETVMMRNNLLSGFCWVCELVSEDGIGRDWKRNLGLVSSSKNSMIA